ncbi:MAG: hypothetical protein HN348_12665 [Proteobacteria bacterium]|jgi:hypothetical protein|nr:hypothetical protein [Pseudomonadota bacterium]
MTWTELAQNIASKVAARVSRYNSGVLLFRLVLDDGRFSAELAQWSVDTQNPVLAQQMTMQRISTALCYRHGSYRGTVRVFAGNRAIYSQWIKIDE